MGGGGDVGLGAGRPGGGDMTVRGMAGVNGVVPADIDGIGIDAGVAGGIAVGDANVNDGDRGVVTVAAPGDTKSAARMGTRPRALRRVSRDMALCTTSPTPLASAAAAASSTVSFLGESSFFTDDAFTSFTLDDRSASANVMGDVDLRTREAS